MRLTLSLLTLITTTIVAYGQISDIEIENAYKLCNRPDHFIPIGRARNRPEGAGTYKPEWKQCEMIDKEYIERDLAKKEQQKREQEHINSLINRLEKDTR